MDIKEENIDEENQVKENQVKKNQVKENINSQKKEQDILIEESVASFLHKLKALYKFLENVMEVFGMICLFFGGFYKHESEIEKQNKIFKIEYEKEMDKLERERRKIILEKQESIRKINIERRNRIKENDEKYNKILSYLDSIKNDKDKLMEFLKRNNIF